MPRLRLSLDDPALLAAMRADPLGFVRRQDRLIIDEVQRAPDLLLALKLAIDQDRRPGRFLLTGSANLMALPTVADSLAGRVEIHTLLPLSNAEIGGRPADFVERLSSRSAGRSGLTARPSRNTSASSKKCSWCSVCRPGAAMN